MYMACLLAGVSFTSLRMLIEGKPMIVLATNQEAITAVAALLASTVVATIILMLAPLWLPPVPGWILSSYRFLWVAAGIIALEGAALVILILQ